MPGQEASVRVIVCIECESPLDDGSCSICQLPPSVQATRSAFYCADCHIEIGADKRCSRCDKSYA